MSLRAGAWPSLRGGFLFNNRHALLAAVNLMQTDRARALARYGPMRHWIPRRIGNLDLVFDGFIFEDQGPGGADVVTNWDTSGARSMAGMFNNCTNFNQRLAFNTQSVIDMTAMFSGCTAFNQTLDFNTESVEHMSAMFLNCRQFDQPLEFDTESVENMSSMFSGCTMFNNTLRFDTGAVDNMAEMFLGCHTFDQPLTFDTESVTDMSSMFQGCTAFNQTLAFTNTASVDNMGGMFRGCRSFDQPLDFDTRDVTLMSGMFINCHRFNHRLNFNMAAVEDMVLMFSGCRTFNQTLRGWTHVPSDTGDSVKHMFKGCTSFQSPVFTMSLAEYDESYLEHTPLGASDTMSDGIEQLRSLVASGIADLAAQGRSIKNTSVVATARGSWAPDIYAYRSNLDDEIIYRQVLAGEVQQPIQRARGERRRLKRPPPV